MSSIRIDEVIQSSLHPAYINYKTQTSTIVIDTASIPNGTTKTFTALFAIDRGQTKADIYADNGTLKTLVSTSGRAAASVIYSYTSTEVVRFDTEYTTGYINVYFRIINNTGGAVSPSAQTFTISVVQYSAPITTI